MWEFNVLSSLWIGFILLLVAIFSLNEVNSRKQGVHIDWRSSDAAKFVLFSLMQIFLPLFLPYKFKNSFFVSIITAAAFVLSIGQLEHFFESGLLGYSLTAIILRTVSNKTFIDNFAICCSITLNSILANAVTPSSFFIRTIYLWAHFATAYIAMYIQERISKRIFDHMHLLIQLQSMTLSERAHGESIVQDNLSPEILHHLFPCDQSMPNSQHSVDQPLGTLSRAGTASSLVRKFSLGKKSGRAFIDESRVPRVENVENQNAFDAVADAAISEGIVLPFSESLVSVRQLQSINGNGYSLSLSHCIYSLLALTAGVDRRSTVIIALSRYMKEGQEAAIVGKEELYFQQLVTALAARHKITFVRMFGSTWIGCLGFFDSWGNETADSQHGILFACEVLSLERSVREKVSIALDFGYIVGGFLGSPRFDLFGPEVRWVLLIVELKLVGKVFIGESIKKTCNLFLNRKSSEGCVAESLLWLDISQMIVHPPWEVDTIVACSYITFGSQPFRAPEVDDFVCEFCLTKGIEGSMEMFEEGLGFDLSSHPLEVEETAASQRKEEEEEEVEEEVETEPSRNNAKTGKGTPEATKKPANALFEGRHRPQYKGLSARLSATRQRELLEAAWMADLGLEFLTSIYERYGIHLDANLLKETDFHATYRSTEQKLHSILRRVCFPSWTRYMSLWSNYRPRRARPLAPEEEEEGKGKHPEQFRYASPFEAATCFVVRFLHILFRVVKRLFAALQQTLSEKCVIPSRFRAMRSVRSKIYPFQHSHQLNDETAENVDLFREHNPKLYCSELRLCSQKRLWNAAIVCLTHAISLVAAPISGWFASREVLFIVQMLVTLHLVLCVVLEGSYDYFLSGFLVFVRVAILLLTATQSTTCPVIEGNNDFIVPLLVIGCYRVPMKIRTSIIHGNMEYVAIIVIMSYRFSQLRDCSAYLNGILFGLVLVLMQFLYWSLELKAFTCYILEHAILPEARLNYERQKENTLRIVKLFNADALPTSLYWTTSKALRNLPVGVVHVKAADILSGFLDAKDISILLRSVIAIVDECISHSGMRKITQFSGVFVVTTDCAVYGKDRDRSNFARAVSLLQNLQFHIEQFSREHEFKMPIGIAIHHGPVEYIASSLYQVDLRGPSKSLALAMASYHSEGHFASDAYSLELMDDPLLRERVHPQRNVLLDGTSSTSSSSWLRIEGKLEGMQLGDFDYVGMLGRGGYGSVHLVQDKRAGTFYAIKAISLKQGSVMSKMIERECIILQMMQHPNVVNMKFSFITKSRLYLVMPFIRGGNLKQITERDHLGLSHLLLFMAELVLAIEYVHSIGIIHRDIKPANCMIGSIVSYHFISP